MMNTFRKNGGFTLMELLVTIVTASIVTLAATTILLLGIRINRQSIDTASSQTTARILLSAMESIATEGKITRVEAGIDSWKIIGSEGTLFSFDKNMEAIYTGDAPNSETESAAPFMEGVLASYVELNGKLLTVSLKTEDGGYTTSVYCRTLPSYTDSHDPELDKDETNDVIESNKDYEQTDGRLVLLKKLATQYSCETTLENTKIYNNGKIVSGDDYEGMEYSRWYLGGSYSNGWGPQTPWCACFVSWGLWATEQEDSSKLNYLQSVPKYANVDSFMAYFKGLDQNTYGWRESAYYKGGYEPKAGDLIFFDWTINGVKNPEHIGAVITVEGGYVYTIEGNSAGRVAVRKYGLNDPRIIGYGILEWKS